MKIANVEKYGEQLISCVIKVVYKYVMLCAKHGSEQILDRAKISLKKIQILFDPLADNENITELYIRFILFFLRSGALTAKNREYSTIQ